VGGRIEAAFEGGEGTLAVSGDGGRTWAPAAAGDVSALLRQRYEVWVKAEFPGTLASFRLEATVEHNRHVLPALLPGANAVTVSAAAPLPPDRALRVTYRYQEATAPASRKRWDGQGVSYGEVKIAAKDVDRLPAAFTVDVGGNTPPRMLALELSSVGVK
jgi:hypothetical protein